MRLATHVAGGVLAYALVATVARLPLEPGTVAVAGACAALPDVDTLGSTVGRIFAPLARRIEKRFGHRTITHAYAAQLAVALVLYPLVPLGAPAFYVAAVVGYASHPFLDVMTVQGVRLFWPISDRRCVFPYYARQPLRYRTHTGSRADTLLGGAFAVLLVPTAFLHHAGYERVVRLIQSDSGAAVRDFLDLSATRRVWADVDAHDPQNARRLVGRFAAIGTTARDVLVVRDTATGVAYSVGPTYASNFAGRVVTHAGAPVRVERQAVSLAGRALADLDALVPRAASGRRLPHLLDGALRLTDEAQLTPDPARFATAEAAGHALRLRFATLDELDAAGLLTRMVEQGAVTLRVYHAPGDEAPAPASFADAPARLVAFTYAPDDAPLVYVRQGQTVRAGDTLALLHAARIAEARADLDDALARRAIEVAGAETGSSDAVATSRLLEARAALTRAEAEAAAGFASPSTLDAARRGVVVQEAVLARAAAQAASSRRAAQARLLQRDAAVRTARARLGALLAGGALTAPVAGRVVRIETTSPQPDRHALHVLLRPTPMPRAP